MSRAHRPSFPAALAAGGCLPGVAICAICAQTVRLVVSGTAHSQQGLFGL